MTRARELCFPPEVKITDLSFAKRQSASGCSPSVNLGIRELQAVHTPLHLRKRPFFPTQECATDAASQSAVSCAGEGLEGLLRTLARRDLTDDVAS